MNKIPTWVFQLGAGIVYLFANVMCKRFAAAPSWMGVVKMQLIYCVTTFFWLAILVKENSLVVQGIIWSTLTLGISMFVGMYMFHETLNTHQIIGVCFGIIAIALLSF